MDAELRLTIVSPSKATCIMERRENGCSGRGEACTITRCSLFSGSVSLW